MGELVRQLSDIDMDLDDFDHIVATIGTSSTYTGLLVGKKLFKSNVNIQGFCVSEFHPNVREDVLREARAAADFLGVELSIADEDLSISRDYIGEGYDIPTEKGTKAIRELGREEAVILDPVYTGKAMAGLLDYIKVGKINKGSRILFWHTGGLPALFAEEEITGLTSKIWSKVSQ